MKVKLSELNPNPYKLEINGGKLKEEIVKKIQANIKELGLMGSLPIFKRDNKYYLVAGHHRAEALKREFGKNFEVEVTLHNYSDENVLRGMIVENLTQRSDELLEVTENLNAIRTFLKSACPDAGQAKNVKDIQEAGSARNIAEWLNTNGEVMSKSKIAEFLKVYDNLDRRLLKTAFKVEGGEGGKEEGKISIEDAKNLARLDKKDQFEMKDILDKTELDHKGKSKLVTEYLESSDELKKKILDEELDIKDLPIENLKETIKKKIEQGKEKNKGKIVVTHFKQYERESGNRIGRTNEAIVQTCAFLNGLNSSGILYDLDWKTMLRIVEAGTNSGRNYTKFMEKILDKVK